MGEYFLIVNPAKRQYIDAADFDEGIKSSGVLRGHHGRAISLLVCNFDQVFHRSIPQTLSMLGSWWGDPVIAAGDYAPPDTHGIKTSTEAEPERNLHFLAESEYENISYAAMALLCEYYDDSVEPYAEVLANDAITSYSNEMLMHLGNVAFQFDCKPLHDALGKVYGPHWAREYKKARDEHRSMSFIDYRGRGGWFGDTGLSLWLLLLVSEIDAYLGKINEQLAWLREARDEWYLQAIAGAAGRVSLSLDRYLPDDRERDAILVIVEQALAMLSTLGEHVRVSEDTTVTEGRAGDIMSDYLRKNGENFAKLLRGELDMKRWR
jgi:hypothetical protein